MIYELNGETHWEISPACMREVIEAVNAHIDGNNYSTESMMVELSNFRSAFECELHRLADMADKRPIPADNSDLLG